MGTEVIPKCEEAVSGEEPSATELKIIRQIEYYFGNYNLSRDKFLREQLKVDDGWVPLETMIKFNRLKKLSEDFNVIIEALKKSPKQLMEISEDGTKIRRSSTVPLPEEYSKIQEELDKRSVYVKGFKKNNTLDELLDFFKGHKVEHIFMRRRVNQKEKPFKGSVFLTFETREDAEKFLETKGLKYGGTELLKEWKVDYAKRKDEYFDTVRADKERKALKRAGLVKEEENGEKAPEIEMVPGCLLKLSNLDENTTREDIKEMFEFLGTLVYVDYSKGKPSGVLRFESGLAKSALEKVSSGGETVKIGTSDATVTLIEGEEEKEYWKNIAISRAQTRLRFHKGSKSGGNKRKFRKWGTNRQKEKNDDGDKNDESEPPQKRIKVEAGDSNAEQKPADMEITSEAPEVGREASEIKEESES